MIYRKHLTPEERELHVERTHEIWGGEVPLSERKRSLFDWTERAGDGLFLSGLFDQDGQLLCSLKRYRLKLRIAGRETTTVAIGSVFTDLPQRGKGHASRLLTRVMEESREELGCEVALLYSDIGVGLYRRLGFREAPARHWEITRDEIPAGEPLPLRLAIPDDIGLLQRLHRETTAGAPLVTLRDPLTWRMFHALNHIDRDLILMKGDQPVGYLSLSTDRRRNALFVDECCAPGVRPAEIWATLRHLVDEQGLSGARGWSSSPALIPPGSQESDRTRAIPMLASLVEWVKFDPALLEQAYFASSDHL